MLKIVVMAIVGVVIGWFVPILAQKLIDYKSMKNNRTYEEHWWTLKKWCGITCVVFSAGGLGYCGYLNPSWIVLILVGIIWLLGMVTIVVDLRIRIIANEMILAFIPLAIIFRIVLDGPRSVLNSIFTMVIVMTACIILGKIMGLWKVGAGDVKLFGVIGLMYGFPNIVYPVLVTAGAIIIYVLGGFKLYKITMKTMFAMAPFIVAGMLIGIPLILQYGTANLL